METRGVRLSQAANQEMFRLREALKPLLGGDNERASAGNLERNWSLIEESERALGGT